MGLAGQNQVRHMYVGQAGDPANISAIAKNDLVIFSADGSAVAPGADFKLFSKDALGNVISSDTIKADNVLHVKSVAYAAAVNKAVTISALTVDVNTLYTVNIEIEQHGSLSQEDTYLKQGYYKAAAGDDQEAVVDGLIASLNRNFSREIGANASSNPYNFDGDKYIKIVDSFKVDISCETYPTVAVTTAASSGKGTGHQVVEMEYFLLGERGDTYRKNAYPHDIVGPGLVSTKDGKYNLIEIAYFDEGRDEAKKSKKGLTLAVEYSGTEADNASAVNTIVADLNTILGSGSIDALPTS